MASVSFRLFCQLSREPSRRRLCFVTPFAGLGIEWCLESQWQADYDDDEYDYSSSDDSEDYEEDQLWLKLALTRQGIGAEESRQLGIKATAQVFRIQS